MNNITRFHWIVYTKLSFIFFFFIKIKINTKNENEGIGVYIDMIYPANWYLTCYKQAAIKCQSMILTIESQPFLPYHTTLSSILSFCFLLLFFFLYHFSSFLHTSLSSFSTYLIYHSFSFCTLYSYQ